jgi:uncharacterized protein with NRDE domain
MCLVVFAVGVAAHYPLMFAANRDERHARPSRPAGWWDDHPWIFGGRDLVARGGWLAVDRRGRLAAVTNFRDPAAGPAPRSRGGLVTQYLSVDSPIGSFAAELAPRAAQYGPFSLVLIDGAEVAYLSNRAPDAQLPSGVHALSNAALGDDWPKTRTARAGLTQLLDHEAPLEPLFELLALRAPPEAAEDRYRSALFVDGEEYGTRSSTVVLLDRGGQLTFAERSFDASGRRVGEVRAAMRVASVNAGSKRRESA